MRRGFVIHHNGPPASCLGRQHSRCESFWRAVRDYHVNTKGWSDIAYSFGVCPHGTRFTGRGWDKPQFANGADVVGPDDGADRYWYTVLVFLGGDEKPTAEMVQATAALIDEGRAWGRCMDRVLPHNAFKPKACPGPEFTAYAKAWDNQPLSVEDDDMSAAADEIIAAINERTGLIVNTVNARTGMIYNAVKGLTPDAFADAVAAKIPAAGDVSVEQIKQAVREVFADAGTP